MIYCPQCGTQNKPNSKFCKNCAALLAPSTDVRCPICGTMNPSGAATCSNCDTRLTTTSATPSDRTTPADTPENITPFTPPDTAQEGNESESAPPASSPPARRSFSRSSSEWLRRVQKTPPPEPNDINSAAAAAAASLAAPAATNVSKSSPAPTPASAEPDDIPDWLREIQNEANRQAAAEKAAAVSVDADDASVADAHLAAAAAAGIVATDPLADRTRTNGVEVPPGAQVETPAPTKPQLSEIKLTGDDYDYSDIGGQVTPEMQAELEANAANLKSVDDETALARKLLGLDVDEPTVVAAERETPNLAPIAAGAVAAQALSGDEPSANIETPVSELQAPAAETTTEDLAPAVTGAVAADALASQPSIAEMEAAEPTPAVSASAPLPASTNESSSAQEDERSHVPGIVAGVAAMGAAASSMFSGEQATPPAASETPAPTKPQLSEIKLTGDDYDYSDIGGQVTPEMQAELEANAANLKSVDDETALARKLLGLDVDEPPVVAAERETPNLAPVAAGAVAADALAAQPPAVTNVVVENTQTPEQEKEGINLAGAIAGVAAVGALAGAVLDKDEDESQETPAVTQAAASTDAVESPTLAVGATAVTEIGDAPAALQEAAPAEAQAETGAVPPVAETAVVVEQTNVQTQEDERSPAWVTALAAASSAAVVAAVVSDKDDTTRETPPEDSGHDVPPALAVGATAAALDAAEENELAEQTELESGEIPDWLREIAPEEISGVKPLTPEEEGALPAWVQELAPSAAALGTVAYLSQVPELDEGERADLPEWLQEPVAPTPESLSTGAAAAAAADAEGPSGEPPLELPSWFADPAITSPARDPFEVVEMTGPLAGISGILPLALAITEPHRLTTPTPPRSDGGRIFQTLLAEPLASTAHVETETKSKKLFTSNHLLYLVILVAAIVPLFFGLEQAGLGLNATTSGTALFYDELQTIPANGIALLAFEYNPGTGVELDPAARAIVNDLAERRVDVIALTSNPNGATLAQNILERARETHPEFSFVNMGYIPGNEAGLRALASGWLPAGREDVNGVPWGSTPLAGRVRNMDDLALTVLVVGDDTTLRSWMEQVQPRVTSSIIAATSAMLEPQARNYVNADQLQASLRGLTGAAELELLSNQTGPAVKTMDAFSIVSLVIAGIIIVANIMLFVRRKK